MRFSRSTSVSLCRRRLHVACSTTLVMAVATLVAQCSAFGTVISRSALLSATAKPSDYDPVFDTIMRFELKQELLQSMAEFQQLQQEMFQTNSQQQQEKTKRRWVRRVKDGEDPIGGAFGAQSFSAIQVDLGDKGEEVIALAERLSTLNPCSNPTRGWMGYGDGSPDECLLDGNWKLQFTSGADATFPESAKRGKARTSQIVNATKGTLTNVIDFEKGKITGFRVVVEGTACSDTEMDLTFKKVIIHRDSRFPRLFGRITIRLPSFRFLSAYSRFASKGKSQAMGPGFEIQYMDKDMRMHKTRDGIWFIQTRLRVSANQSPED